LEKWPPRTCRSGGCGSRPSEQARQGGAPLMKGAWPCDRRRPAGRCSRCGADAVQARQQRGQAGAAQRAGHVAERKDGALGGEAVEARRADDLMAHEAEVGPAWSSPIIMTTLGGASAPRSRAARRGLRQGGEFENWRRVRGWFIEESSGWGRCRSGALSHDDMVTPPQEITMLWRRKIRLDRGLHDRAAERARALVCRRWTPTSPS